MPNCVYCQRHFFDKRSFAMHSTASHGFFKCCGILLEDYYDVTSHFAAYHPKPHQVTQPSTFECNICFRKDFKDQRALNSHLANPGTAHAPRTSPCTCPVENLRVIEAKRVQKDQFIYKVVLSCDACGRSPITVPLAADKALATGLEVGFGNLHL